MTLFRRRGATVLLLVICVAAGGAVVITQNANPSRRFPATESRRLLFQQIRVKPEMIDAFVYVQRNETVPALKKAGVAWRDAYQTATIGRTGLFVFVTELLTLKELDGAGPVERALGDGFSAYRSKLRSMIEEAESSIIRTRPDLSISGNANLVPRLAVVARIETQPGKHLQFESWVKQDYLNVVRQSNCRAHWMSQTLLGGSGNEYWSLTLGDSFAAFDESPMMRVLSGGVPNSLSERAGNLVVHVEQYVVRYRDDLSFHTP